MTKYTLEQLIRAGWISVDVAIKHSAEIAQYQEAGKSGYLVLFRNGLGPALHGHQLPYRESMRWRDSFIAYLEPERSPEDTLAAAVERTIPI